MTTGSGATFNDGDIRVEGKFLLEHKFRNMEQVVLPYSTFEKIRSQADRQGLIAALGITNSLKQDFIVMQVADYLELDAERKLSIVRGGLPRRTIVAGPNRYCQDAVTFLNITCEGAKELCMITLDDFRRLNRKPV